MAKKITRKDVNEKAQKLMQTVVFFDIKGNAEIMTTDIYKLENLKAGMSVDGPAIILN